jgi:hypothetical protein
LVEDGVVPSALSGEPDALLAELPADTNPRNVVMIALHSRSEPAVRLIVIDALLFGAVPLRIGVEGSHLSHA